MALIKTVTSKVCSSVKFLLCFSQRSRSVLIVSCLLSADCRLRVLLHHWSSNIGLVFFFSTVFPTELTVFPSVIVGASWQEIYPYVLEYCPYQILMRAHDTLRLNPEVDKFDVAMVRDHRVFGLVVNCLQMYLDASHTTMPLKICLALYKDDSGNTCRGECHWSCADATFHAGKAILPRSQGIYSTYSFECPADILCKIRALPSSLP